MIFGVDPGPKVSTWVKYGDNTILAFGRDVANHTLLENIALADAPIIVEDIENMGQTVGESTFLTARWSGRFEERAFRAGVELHFLKRTAIKLHLCGKRNCKGTQVRLALLERFGNIATAGIADHAWSALAIAVTWEDQHALDLQE